MMIKPILIFAVFFAFWGTFHPRYRAGAKQNIEPSPAETSLDDNESKEQEDARKRALEKEQSIILAIQYGLDTEVIAILQNLLLESPRKIREDRSEHIHWIEESPFNAALLKRLEMGYSSGELKTKVIQFFLRQDWQIAKQYVIETLEEEAASSKEQKNSLLLACLSYLRYLNVTAAESQILELLSNTNPLLVSQSIYALGDIGSLLSAKKFASLLTVSDSSVFDGDFSEKERQVIHIALITTLGNLKYQESIPALLDILRNENERYSEEEWSVAAQALGKLEVLEALPYITDRLQSDIGQHRYQSIKAIREFPLQDIFEKITLQCLQDSYWKTRLESARVVAKFKFINVVPSLRYRVRKDDTSAVRKESIRALYVIEGSGSPSLEDLLLSSDIGKLQRAEILTILVQERDSAAMSRIGSLISGDTEKAYLLKDLLHVAEKHAWEGLDFIYRDMLEDELATKRIIALRAIKKERIQALSAEVAHIAEFDKLQGLRAMAHDVLRVLDAYSK